MTFPAIAGENLLGAKVAFPGEIGSLPVLAVVAFDLKQRAEVESWLPFIEGLQQQGAVRVRLFAVLSRGMKLLRGPIVKAFRGAAVQAAQREATVLVFDDVDAFCSALEIVDRGAVQVFLVAAGGTVVARANGPFAAEAGTRLRERLKEFV
ncbi:MAG: hypothetical protein NVSMB64_01360 [Candidatus Velthaea sp.]